MSSDLIHVHGVGELRLGATIARAGEGTIRELVGHPDSVAKIFHPDLKNLGEKREKVTAMVRDRPPTTIEPDGFVVLTWPTHVIDKPGDGVGYIMPRIHSADAVEIHIVSNPSHR